MVTNGGIAKFLSGEDEQKRRMDEMRAMKELSRTEAESEANGISGSNGIIGANTIESEGSGDISKSKVNGSCDSLSSMTSMDSNNSDNSNNSTSNNTVRLVCDPMTPPRTLLTGSDMPKTPTTIGKGLGLGKRPSILDQMNPNLLNSISKSISKHTNHPNNSNANGNSNASV